MKSLFRALGASLALSMAGCQTAGMKLEIEPHHDDPSLVYGSIVNRAEKAHLESSGPYQAVAIYEFRGGESFFTGLGTIVRRPNMDPVIVTVAHMFRTNEQAKYFYETLPYGGTSFDRALASVAPAKKSMTLDDRAAWDVAIARLGHGAPISGFYPWTGSSYEAGPTGFVERSLKLRSLVDGSTITVVAESLFLHGAVAHAYAAEYRSRGGESGTGFVDAEGRLYILKGYGCLSSQDSHRIGVPESKSFTILIGPVRI